MELPIDIWENILNQCDDKQSCKNLFKALPCKVQLEPSYNIKMDNFTQIYLVIIKNILIIFKDDGEYHINDFGIFIKNAVFSGYRNEVMVLLENNDIFFYNFENDLYYPITIPQNDITSEKHSIFFYKINWQNTYFIFVANRFDMYFFKYSQDNPEYFYNLHQSTTECNKKFMIELNDVHPELASFIYYRKNGSMFYELKLLNHSTKEIIYMNNDLKIRGFCFDEYGKFFFCDNDFIYTLDEENKIDTFYIFRFLADAKVDRIYACNHFLYYCVHMKNYNRSFIYFVDYKNCDPYDDESIIIVEFNGRIDFMKIYQYKYLIYGTSKETYFYNLHEKKIERTVNSEYLFDHSKIIQYIDFAREQEMKFDILLPYRY